VSEALLPRKRSSRPLQRTSYWLITTCRRSRVDVWSMGLSDGRSGILVEVDCVAQFKESG
jgi:hypothetical protein